MPLVRTPMRSVSGSEIARRETKKEFRVTAKSAEKTQRAQKSIFYFAFFAFYAVSPSPLNSKHLNESRTKMQIRPFADADWPSLLPILRSAISSGDTFAWDPECPDDEIRAAWVEHPDATFVACDNDSRVLGCYFIKTNQPGLGSHVANAGYCVDPAARGRGIAAEMCKHSQVEAAKRGFRSMQFNIVVATNTPAVHLWQKLGFDIVGRLPGAFDHRQLGYVDAFVMFKRLIA